VTHGSTQGLARTTMERLPVAPLRRRRAMALHAPGLGSVLALAVVWLGGCSAPQDPLAEVRETIPELLETYDLPSIAVAVAINGEIVWEEGFGFADREAGTPATEHTMYSLASISKPMTATGLMTLVEEGLIDLSEPIDNYLGGVKVNGRAFDASGATVRRVASHTAGLPLHYQFFYEDEPYRRPPMDVTILRYANLVTAPGERYQYSNLGFGLLDYVISRVSGETYADFMRDRVFVPLGMTHTSVDVAPGLEDFAAARYATDGSRIPFYDFDHPGGSAVWSSAHDLVKFGMFHLQDDLPEQTAILADATIDAMHRPVSDSGLAAYGLGWQKRSWSGGLWAYGHTGGMGGVSTSLTIVPERDIAVVVLLNASSPVTGYLTERILSALAPAEVPRPDRPRVGAGSQEAERAPLVAPASLRGAWVGAVDTYEGERAVRVDVLESGARVRLAEQPPVNLEQATFDGTYLRGSFRGDLGTEDTNRTDHELVLELRVRGEVMNGSLIALSLPAVRVGNALTHWVELRRSR
jgi:CubicO group peptidase (beta-lactamase class C family)